MGRKPEIRSKIAPGYMIAKLREEKKMTPETLAKELDMSEASVSRLERGIQNYKKQTIDKLCKIFKVSPNLLFTADEKEEEVLKILQKDPSK